MDTLEKQLEFVFNLIQLEIEYGTIEANLIMYKSIADSIHKLIEADKQRGNRVTVQMNSETYRKYCLLFQPENLKYI